MTVTSVARRSSALNLVAFGMAASAALVVLFVLCWLVAAVLPGVVSASHGWINLFSKAPVDSARALAEGLLWSIVFGWIIAVVMVPIYNKIAASQVKPSDPN